MNGQPKSSKPLIAKAIAQGMTVYSVSREPLTVGEIMNASTCPKCGTPRGNLPWCTTCVTREAVAPLANLTGFCRANTICPECGTTVYEGREAYVTPYNAPDAYLHVALHPQCGPQVRDDASQSSRDTRDA